jgi:hypothetical protein
MTFVELSEVLGNLGEFVGAIAVFITLIYLAVQVRVTRRSTDFLIAQGLTGQYNQVNALLVANPELGELIYKSGREPDSLTPQDRDRLGYLMIQWFQIFDYVLALGKRGIVDDRWVRGVRFEMERARKSGASRDFVARNEHWFSPELLAMFKEGAETEE